ncbi:unnamed protein product [Miscanthus lutarioriparius]|uniref:Uncharacterized protein n=1 Tax=Miscanthus lutarioriparius TaxID=422564 RepID=A0A811NR98_9POAL|nr:unnamed protein product [Miscanthus lutarioriparius]
MEAAAQTILRNDGLLLSEEYRLLSGVGGEVAELRDDKTSPPHAIRGRGRRRGLLRPGMDEAAVRARLRRGATAATWLRIKSRPSDGMHAQAIGFGHLTASPATSTPWAPAPSPSSPAVLATQRTDRSDPNCLKPARQHGVEPSLKIFLTNPDIICIK